MSEEESRLDRILRALSHPLRRRILGTLAERPGSASSMAAEYGIELSVLSYHLNRVLAAGCNAVDLVEMIPKGGSVEKIYRLNADLWSDWEWFPVTVDSKAWKEIQAAKRKFSQRVGAVIKEGEKRGMRRRRNAGEAIVGIAAMRTELAGSDS